MVDKTSPDRSDDFLPRVALLVVVAAVSFGLISMFVLNPPLVGGVNLEGRSSFPVVPTDKPSGLGPLGGAPPVQATSPVVSPGQPALPAPVAKAQAPAPAAKAQAPAPAVPKAVNIPQPANRDSEGASAAAALGNQASQRQDYATAIQQFSRALELDPSAVFYSLRGDVNWRAGKLDDAMADYNAVLTLDPTNADGFYGRSRVFRDKGDKASAIADLEQFLALKPDEPAHAGIRDEAKRWIEELRQ